MKIFFRKLTRDDIPTIIEISKDIWEGEDYVPDVIERWLKDDNCLNYGGFADLRKTKMIGFGRVKIFSNGVAWLEGGRVKSSEQKKGIGRELMRYAIDYARDHGSKIAQYDTSSENEGSIALAKYFGFKKKKSIQCVICETKNLTILNEQIPPIEKHKIDARKAKKEYIKFDIGPGNEINIGWSYIPLEFLNDQGSSWYTYKNSILQKRGFSSQDIGENPNTKDEWLITYGDPIDSSLLIKNIILSEVKNRKIDFFVVFCSLKVVDLIKEFGFSYWDDQPISVVLFEKNLSII